VCGDRKIRQAFFSLEACLPWHANPHRPPPSIWKVAYASEGFAMTNNTFLFPSLHALIGDIASDVPKDLAREIECALKEQFPSAQPMFFTFLDAIRRGDGEDGQPCTTQMLNAQTLASLGRSLSALTAVLDLLHAAERARVDGNTDGQIGDFHRNGLLLAARQIAHAAQTGLGDAITAVANKPG